MGMYKLCIDVCERAQTDKHTNTRIKEIKKKKKQQEQEPIEIDCPNGFLCFAKRKKSNNNNQTYNEQ